MGIANYSPKSGRMIKEDGTVVNIADMLAGDAEAVSESAYNIDSFSAQSGRMIREDGSIINIADLIASGQIPGGGGGGGTTNYNDLTNKPKLGGVELSGDMSLSYLGIAEVVTQVDHSTEDTTFKLLPNQYHTWGEVASLTLTLGQYHTWGEVASLTLTLGAGTSGQANGYWFSFDSGDTATTLSLPETVITDIVVEPNMHYECSIVGNHMTFEEWEVSA